MFDPKVWTFGAEHEFSDIDRRKKLPAGYTHNTKDYTVVNSNGIANDPKNKLYHFGGEINTPGTGLQEQVRCLVELLDIFPEAKVNYRSNLHVHVRVPGLKKDLNGLRQVQAYIHSHMRDAFDVIEPIPVPTRFEFSNHDAYMGAMRRCKRRKVSHHTLLTPNRLAYQFEAKTVKDFFEREVPHDKAGKPLWHLQPRLCVSLRQLLETDTIEFRHFPGTLDPVLLWNCLEWCRQFLLAAFDDRPFERLLKEFRDLAFPEFPLYDHEMERRYRATCHDGTLDEETIRRNIELILAGKFQ